MQNQTNYVAMLSGDPSNNTGNPNETSLFTDCLDFMLGPKQEDSDICEGSRSEYLREIH